jgi:RND family efflux transporter MFP subunit
MAEGQKKRGSSAGGRTRDTKASGRDVRAAVGGRLRKIASLSARTMAPVVVLALAIVSFIGLKATKPEVPQRPRQERVWPVNVVQAEITDYQPALRLYGRTIAGRRVELRTLIAGEVVETGPGLRNGGVVKKGDVLLKIDPFEYDGALVEAEAKLAEARAKALEIEATIQSEQDSLKRAKEQLEIAKRDLERAVPLAEKGTVSQKLADDRRMIVSEREQGLDQRVNNLQIQQAKAAQQRAVISQLQWRVRQAKRNLEDSVLRAPFDSYVTGVAAERGKILGANDQVATLFDRDWIDVRFTLTNAQYGRIVAAHGDVTGRIVNVFWHIGEQPLRYQATIERVAAEITADSGGVEVFARVTNPHEPVPLRPGAFVEVQMTDKVYSNVVRLPQTALYGGDTVFVVQDERLAPRKVELVGAAKAHILVRGELKPGEVVMTSRLSKAEAGLKVKEQ